MKKSLVLVADDDADTVEAYGLLFRSRGHEVEAAMDGPSAVVKAMALRPDVILLDLGLPLMDGREVLRRLRQPMAPRIPVLVLTGHAAANVVASVLDEGADHVMIKPCDPRDLCERVEMLLKGAPASTTGDGAATGEPEKGSIRAPKPRRYRARAEARPAAYALGAPGAVGPVYELSRVAAALRDQAVRLRQHARLAYAQAIAIRTGQVSCWRCKSVLAATSQPISD